jgi:MFS family permease
VKSDTPRSSSVSPFLSVAVWVAALGYFVDIYDLILFSIVRLPSLASLGVTGEAAFAQGMWLLNLQMAGMLLGGIFWGVLGDKRGRLSVLFGSILMYSVANFLNGFVRSVEAYAVLRFVAGVGLAGELGAGITLVAETLPRTVRGYGTTLVASVGICGALLAAWVARNFDWRHAYVIGGVLGFLLLMLRVGVFESSLFESVKQKTVRRGDFLALFRSRGALLKYIRCVLIGLPTWFVVGILITFSPEIARELGVTGPLNAGEAVQWCYLGLALGDLSSGLLSQRMGSRRAVVALFLALTTYFTGFYLAMMGVSVGVFYTLCGILGFSAGYWAIFVTMGAEQFGTNLRATVATTVPNFVRGSVIPVTLFFSFLKPRIGILSSGLVVGMVCLVLAAIALYGTEETFHKDLDYLEPLS